jgi:SAM-dependent methyltransferase
MIAGGDTTREPSRQEEPLKLGRWYQRCFAAAQTRENKHHEAMLAARKGALLSGLDGDVLEIGPGGGPNLGYYAPTIHWIGVEPNPHMHPYLYQTAARYGLEVDLRQGTAEALPALDHSLDAVVSTLVLCSVHDPAQVLAEARRVLRPGGRFIFLEHVAAPAGSGLRRWQNLARPLWQVVGDGCHPNRETGVAIQHAGFADVHLEYFKLPIPFIPDHIAGYAIAG